MQPLVSVRVITFNHEKYIRDCLEGILMQKTDFQFEAVIGEDCSTDQTREIVTGYAEKYPDKIRMILSESNAGAYENIFRVQKACRGKYQAFCDGDDYWTDPLKLQKQADFLESHPDFTLCFHNALMVWEDSPKPPEDYSPRNLNDIVSIEDILLRPWFIPTASIMALSSILLTIPAQRRR